MLRGGLGRGKNDQQDHPQTASAHCWPAMAFFRSTLCVMARGAPPKCNISVEYRVIARTSECKISTGREKIIRTGTERAVFQYETGDPVSLLGGLFCRIDVLYGKFSSAAG